MNWILNNRKLVSLAIFGFLFFTSANPVVFAQSNPSPLVFCNKTVDGTGQLVDECGFNELLELAQRIMTFLIYLSVPLAAISFAWAGSILITSGGNPAKRDKAKSIFMKTLVGFIFVLSAWLIVYTIISALVDTNQNGVILLEENPGQ